MKRNIYISNTDLDEAFSKYLSNSKEFINNIEKEKIITEEALNRVSAKPVYAKKSSPNHNAAAMDGIAVKAEMTYGASESNPIILNKKTDFEYVNTGNELKTVYDAVVMIEDITAINENEIKIIEPAAPWKHVRPIGEDIVIGEMIIPSNHKIRPIDIAAIYSSGVPEVEVYKKIKVGIIPTGNEIVKINEKLEKGKIYDSNSQMFAAMIKELHGEPEINNPVEDDFEKLKQGVCESVEKNNIVIINAGSSAGSKDFTKKVIEELGEVKVHGIAIKPGKPTILGIVKGKPVIGIPGYPVSSYFVFKIFVEKIIRLMQSQGELKENYAEAVLSRRIVSSIKHKEFVRIKLGKVDHRLIATPLDRGAGVIMSLVKADGILEVPQSMEGVEAGEVVNIKLLNNINEINNTLVAIGSHDIILDVISDLLHVNYPKYSFSSAHTGSMGGITAMRKGECHIAPIHLLNPDTGIYNTDYVKKYIKNKEMVLIKGVKREQGIMVSSGNPKKIKSLLDLQQKDIKFVNRQNGSGTRILTDYLLKKENIERENIVGYQRELTTHTSVAAAVESGSADVGIGVYAVAKSFKLDFISIGYEEYDFLVPKKYIETDLINKFIEIMKSKEFTNELDKLGGYKYDTIGKIVDI